MAIVATIAVSSVVAPRQHAQAGPLCDWLFGRRTAAYYPPPAAVPYAAGYPQQVAYPYQAAYPYAAAYPGTLYPGTTAAPALTLPATANGAAALQMPAYSAGYGTYAAIPAQPPGDQGYAMYTPPAGTSYPPNVPTTSFYGTGNVYPTYNTPYQAGYGAVAPATAVAPVTAYYPPVVNTNPSTVQTYPGTPAAPPGLLGGISRFFGNVLGTGYSSSYYRAPVTYYRPVTTVDPTTGVPTTVQRPCSSYEYQLQRSPVTTFAPGAPAVTAPPANCAPTTNYYNPYGSVAPATTDNYAPTMTSPSMTSPSTGGVYPQGASNPDQINIGQPQLQNSSRPPLGSENSTFVPQQSLPAAPPTYWTPSGMRSDSNDRYGTDAYAREMSSTTRSSGVDSRRSDLRPLPAGDYPYPVNRPQDDSGMEAQKRADQLQTPPPAPSTTTDSRDRVASTTSWGYKPIDWSVRQASYVSTETASNSRPSESQTADAWAAPVNAPAARAEWGRPITGNRVDTRFGEPARLSEPVRTSGLSSSPGVGQAFRPEPAAAQPPATKPAARSANPLSEYESSGWTSKPRR
jgi:hypothetical protein